jgi:predicted metal-dependent peptidase
VGRSWTPRQPNKGKARAAEQWQAAVYNAAAIAAASEGIGSLPGMIQRLVEAQRNPKEPWRDTLRRFIDRSASFDYSWTRPNRRFISQGLYLPGKVSDACERIVIVCDSSGSVNDKAFQAFIAEMQGILDDGCADKINVAYSDTRVHLEHEYERTDIIPAKHETGGGGGGTDFREAMQWVTQFDDAACVVFFTDMQVYQWGEAPDVPVLWASWEQRHPRPTAPYGETLIIDAFET